MTGKFITLEGIEGVGKTSNLGFIRAQLEAAGKPCITTREPGGTELGESLRAILLGHSDQNMSADTELLLMFAARAEHIDKVIRPALDAGEYVLCDRFTEATYAYQGGGRQLGNEKIADLEQWVQDDLRPDLTIILDAPVSIGRARAGKRSAPDRIEKEKDDFFNRVRSAYRDMALRYPHRIALVDASQHLEDVQEQIRARLIEHNIID